ncbi:MAG: hypothetical protein KAQ83_01255, partial [Nanoarchaeota archaeon]|nr:hypothetical protein [Nanoarchaeota archaeon]
DSNKQDDSDLRKNLSEEVKKDLKALHDLFDEIKGKLIQQKKARRDQRLGWHTVREFTLEWQTLLFHDLKHGSKKVKREISHVKKHLKKLHLVIMALKNNDKVDDKLIKELRNNIHDIKHEMTVEIEQLFKMEKTVVFLLNRLQKDNEEEYKKMTNLGSSGFPTNILEEMEEHEKSYLSVLKKQEKDESIRSKSIIINEKD